MQSLFQAHVRLGLNYTVYWKSWVVLEPALYRPWDLGLQGSFPSDYFAESGRDDAQSLGLSIWKGRRDTKMKLQKWREAGKVYEEVPGNHLWETRD